jgi:hypothetical protein
VITKRSLGGAGDVLESFSMGLLGLALLGFGLMRRKSA